MEQNDNIFTLTETVEPEHKFANPRYLEVSTAIQTTARASGRPNSLGPYMYALLVMFSIVALTKTIGMW